MNKIKVTVTYEKPITTKFDALMEEYNAAKKHADAVVSYYQPLADMAEEVKCNAIMEQLETIKRYAKQIYDLSNKKHTVRISATIYHDVRGHYASSNLQFEVGYHPSGHFYVIWGGVSFDMDRIRNYPWQYCESDRNILGNWDEWKVYEKLEKEACEIMQRFISDQAHRADKQIDRLNNITKGGN